MRPVPLPRGTTVQVVRGGRPDARHDVVRGGGEDHEAGGALHHRRVAGVEAEGERIRENRVGAQRLLELSPRRVQVRHRGLG